MQATKGRISRLETQIRDPKTGAKLVIISAPYAHQVTDLLAAQGIDENDEKHAIIVLRTFYEEKSGELSKSQSEPKILFMMDRE